MGAESQCELNTKETAFDSISKKCEQISGALGFAPIKTCKYFLFYMTRDWLYGACSLNSCTPAPEEWNILKSFENQNYFQFTSRMHDIINAF